MLHSEFPWLHAHKLVIFSWQTYYFEIDFAFVSKTISKGKNSTEQTYLSDPN